ncbi:MAG TPA: hypothetical protein ENL08_00190, partial [Bacteroidetes bacterium]|nr:hypothetical protein [Bacteroidota bacterium]
MPRVLFYFFKNVHAPVMLPIYRELSRDPRFEIAICSPFDQYVRELRAGFKEGEEAILPRGEVPVVEKPQEWRSDVVFIADSVTHLVQGCGRIINVGHGLLSKGQYFTDTDYIHRENLEHLLLVPGEYHKQAIRDSGRVFIPVEAVGYPKMDMLFQPEAPSRDELCGRLGLDPAKKIILYAPTFNVALSTIPVVWTRIKELATPDTCLLIKFHGSTLPEFVSAHMTLPRENPNIYLIDDPDITPYLQIADVMVSDVSSAWMEFILLDKPVVLFNNPNCKEYINYDRRDIEYAWRDVGIQVTSLEGMKRAVVRSLERPEELSERRNYYIGKLGVNLDGNAARRVRDLTWELLDGRISKRRLQPVQKVTIVLIDTGGDPAINVNRVEELSQDCGIEASFIALDGGIADDNEREAAASTDGLLRIISLPDLPKVLEGSDFLGLLPLGARGWDRWLFRLVNHLRRDSSLDAVVPLSSRGEMVQRPDRYIQALEGNDYTTRMTDMLFKSSLVAQNIPLDGIPAPDTGLVRLGTPAAERVFEWLGGSNVNPFSSARLALDVVVERPASPSRLKSAPGAAVMSDGRPVSGIADLEKRIAELAYRIGSD